MSHRDLHVSLNAGALRLRSEKLLTIADHDDYVSSVQVASVIDESSVTVKVTNNLKEVQGKTLISKISVLMGGGNAIVVGGIRQLIDGFAITGKIGEHLAIEVYGDTSSGFIMLVPPENKVTDPYDDLTYRLRYSLSKIDVTRYFISQMHVPVHFAGSVLSSTFKDMVSKSTYHNDATVAKILNSLPRSIPAHDVYAHDFVNPPVLEHYPALKKIVAEADTHDAFSLLTFYTEGKTYLSVVDKEGSIVTIIMTDFALPHKPRRKTFKTQLLALNVDNNGYYGTFKLSNIGALRSSRGIFANAVIDDSTLQDLDSVQHMIHHVRNKFFFSKFRYIYAMMWASAITTYLLAFLSSVPQVYGQIAFIALVLLLVAPSMSHTILKFIHRKNPQVRFVSGKKTMTLAYMVMLMDRAYRNNAIEENFVVLQYRLFWDYMNKEISSKELKQRLKYMLWRTVIITERLDARSTSIIE